MTRLMDISSEFDGQLENFLLKDYPKLLSMTVTSFKAELEPLKSRLPQALKAPDIQQGQLPFVLVVQSPLLKTDTLMARLDFYGKAGIVNMTPRQPDDFSPVDLVTLPAGLAYLLIGIDRGKEFLNITPEHALKTLLQQNRSPLTLHEGIAVLTHYPEFLQKNNCFSLLASRTTDQRVPALWISEKRPKLGWCWDRNPHTWLGSASCKMRIGKE